MTPFRFRAAAALDLRRRQEDESAAALARVEARLAEAVRSKHVAIARRTAAAEALAAAGRAGTDAETWRWHRNWMIGLSAAIEACTREVQQVTVAVDAARHAWSAARRRRLMLERLREHAVERYRLAAQRDDIKQMDELARARYTTPPAGAERSQE